MIQKIKLIPTKYWQHSSGWRQRMNPHSIFYRVNRSNLQVRSNTPTAQHLFLTKFLVEKARSGRRAANASQYVFLTAFKNGVKTEFVSVPPR